MSLPRVLEPEVMDTAAEALDYDRMDHSQVNQTFVDDLAAWCDVQGDILDLGTGTAQIPVLLCAQHSDCRVMAVDASVSMLDLARYNVEAEGLIERITLAHVDAKQLNFADGMFNLVVSNSIIHHIPEPIDCIEQAVRVTRSGGRLFFRDLMRPADQAELDQLVETYAAHESEHACKMFAESLAAALTVDEVRQWVSGCGFDGQTVQPTSDRHWTWAAIKA